MSSAAVQDIQRPRARDAHAQRQPRQHPGMTREQLLRNIQLISSIVDGDILPARLPTPSRSRSASPERGQSTGSKRKLAVKSEYDEPALPSEHAKRPRLSAVAEHHFNQPHASTSTVISTPQGNPEPMSVDVKSLPIRRSRRGASGEGRVSWGAVATQYHKEARRLKYSGHERLWSSLPPSHKSYKPPKNPIPVNSPYNTHAALMSRLELVDAVVCFMYSLWLNDCTNPGPEQRAWQRSWRSMVGFLQSTQKRWNDDKPRDDREKAFIGLLKTLEGYMYAKLAINNVRSHDNKQNTRRQIHAIMSAHYSSPAVIAAADAAKQPVKIQQQPTPPMLPSPASIGQPDSAHSTPRTGQGDSPQPPSVSAPSPLPSSNPTNGLLKPPQPSYLTSTTASLAGSNSSSASGSALAPPSTSTTTASSSSTTSSRPQTEMLFPVQLAYGFRQQCDDTALAQAAFFEAEKSLNLQVLARHFPATFARMVNSTLLPHEELEPDMEDDEGELRWPSQSMTGDGLGWASYIGRAMVREFGRDVGYLGVHGALDMEEEPAKKASGTGPEAVATVNAR